MKKQLSLSLLIALFTLIGAATSSAVVTNYWWASTSSALWSTAADWVADQPTNPTIPAQRAPSDGAGNDYAICVGTNGVRTIDIAATRRNVRGILFSNIAGANGFTFVANGLNTNSIAGLNLRPDGVTNLDGDAQTFSVPIFLFTYAGGNPSATTLFPIVASGGDIVFQDTWTSGSNTLVLLTNQGGTLVVTGAANVTFGTTTRAGIINGAGGLKKSGSGSLTFLGNSANTYGGNTIVSNGTVNCFKVNALGTAGLAVFGGTVNISTNNQTVAAVTNAGGTISGASGTLNGTVYQLQSGTVSANLTGSGNINKSTAGTSTLSGNNSLTGNTTNAAGTLSLGANNALGSGALIVNGGTVDLATFNQSVGNVTNIGGTISGSSGVLTGSSYVMKGGIVSASLAGAATLTAPSGTTTLSGSNSYSGGTTISGGTLLVNTSTGSGTGSGTVTVNSGTLGGSGTISGAITVNSGANICAGGNLNIAQFNTTDQSWQGGATNVWEINDAAGSAGTGSDFINITGALTISASPATPITVDVTSLNGSVAGNAANFNNASTYSWTILTASGGITGFSRSSFVLKTTHFGNAVGNGAFDIVQSGNSLVVIFVQKPAIVTPPQSTTVTYGQNATFTVAASGEPTLTYQWKKNGIDISGATATSLTITPVVADSGSVYSVAVTNGYGGLVSSGGTLTINRATLTVTGVNASRAYGAADPAFSATYSGFVNGDTSAVLSGSPSITTTATVTSSVGTYSITPAQGTLSTANYTFSFADGTLTINKASITVTADNKSKTYGSANPAFTATYSGFANGENSSVVTGTPGLNCSADATTAVGTAAITIDVTGLSAANYTFTGVNGTLTISAASLTVNVDNKAKATGSANPALTGSLVGIQNSDNITASYSTTAVDGSPTGNYPITATLNDPDSKLGNYNVTTNNGTLSVQDGVAITTQPGSITNDAMTTATFTVVATGASVSYQWKKNGSNLTDAGNVSGATTATLTVTNVLAPDQGTYTVVVSNAVGSVTSSDAILTVNDPAITNQPSSITVNAGTSATLTVDAVGTTALSYQWNKEGSPIGGATDSSYAIATAYAANAGNYTVVVTNVYGSVTSSVAVVTVNDPVINTQPASQTVAAGSSVTFNVAAAGTATVAYQWKKNGVNISGATDSALTINSVTGTDTAAYSVGVTNGLGSGVISSGAVLSVSPAVITPPASQTVAALGSLTLTVVADGQSTLAYQWQKNGSNISGATQSSYSIVTVHTNDAGNYTVAVSNGAGSVTSSAAAVTVNQVSQSISFTSVGSKTYGNAPVTLSATASSGLAVGFSVDSGPGSLSGNVLTIAGAGTIVVRATQAGNADYSAASDVTQSIIVNKTTLTVTADNQSKVYGAANPTFTASYSGFVNGETLGTSGVSGNPSLTTTASGAGSYTISAAAGSLASANYAFAFVDGTLTVTKAALTVTADDQTRQYGSANPTLTASYSGFVNGDTASSLSGTPSVTTTATPASPVSTYTITVAAGTLASGNYTLGFINGTLTVTQAPLTVTADNKQKATGTANPTLTGSISGILNSDNITANYSTTATTGSSAGTYPITASLVDPGSKLGNYNVTTNNGTLTVVDPPVITLAPANITNNAGTTAAFTAAATGSGALTYQWKKGGVDIAGATTTMLTLSNVFGPDSGTYTFVVSNDVGTAASASATLAVIEPIITSQPQSSTNIAGTTATFSVSAIGTAPFHYQWRLDGALITGATDSAYVITNVRPASIVRAYSVVVSTSYGTQVSSDAVLTVTVPPTVLVQPRSFATTEGLNANLTVSASGTAPLYYQWSKDGVAIAGATSSAVNFTPATTNDTGSYTVDVTNIAGTTTSSAGVMTVAADSTAPKVAILSPRTASTGTSATITATGVASDNVLVSQVLYSLNGAAYQATTGTTSWSVALTLAPGTNTLVVKAVDFHGNQSSVATVTFFYNVLQTFHVAVDNGDSRAGEGPGVTLPVPGLGLATNNALLLVNRPYTILAVPKKNQLFTNWTQTVGASEVVVSTNAQYTFLMQTNLSLTAHFVHNPYMEAQGAYYGLITNSTSDYKISGYITLTVITNEAFSGKAYVDGNVLAFSGKFNINGEATVNVTTPRYAVGKTNLVFNLAMQLGSLGSSGTNQITGTVTDGSLIGNIVADQAVYAKASTNPYKGTYTMALPHDPDAVNNPGGYGYTAINVSSNATALVTAGNLGDGTLLRPQVVPVALDGRWPFYAPAYLARLSAVNPVSHLSVTSSEYLGSVIGWLQFSNNTAIDGTLTWVKEGVDPAAVVSYPTLTYTNYYTNGFTNSLIISAEAYAAPAAGTRLLAVTNATISFADGNLTASQSATLVLKTNNTTTLTSTNANLGGVKLVVRFVPSLGTFSGSFTNAMSAKPILFSGAVLQSQRAAYGYFVGTNETGSVLFH